MRRADRQARKAFEQELEKDEQIDLAREIVETRSSELLRAYPQLVSLSIGYKRKRAWGRLQVRPEPCVIFVVRRKLAENEIDSRDRLPEVLYAYREIEGVRRLCAVPTDVDEVKLYRNAKPQSIEVIERVNEKRDLGAVACAIQRSTHPDETYLISCRHVLSLSRSLHPKSVQCDVCLRNLGSVIGQSLSGIKGHLRDADGDPDKVSFDAQLLKLSSVEGGATLLRPATLEGFAEKFSDIPDDHWAITPHGPVKLKKRGIAPKEPMDYGREGIRSVIHEELVQSEYAGAAETEPGDSGSPVCSRKDGGLLLGMHIAANLEDRVSYFIPAWQLLSPENYRNVAATEDWRLLNADSLQVAGPAPVAADLVALATELGQNHRVFSGSVQWRLAADGIRIDDMQATGSPGALVTVPKVWNEFQTLMEHSAAAFRVPVELIIATICTESGGDPDAERPESLGRMSVGLMQTLIGTAAEMLPQEPVSREWLKVPGNSIMAGTAYIAFQRERTRLDPPVVACAYNAGSVRASASNRWRMHQTQGHADRFVGFFNDCFRFFTQEGLKPANSLYSTLN